MNKLEANISLLLITFFASIQYAFLAGVPAEVSQFSFLCVTNLVGFLIMLLFFYRELARIDGLQVGQSLLLSAELVCFNVFLLAGSADVGATVCASVLSAYFVFVPILGKLFFKEKPDRRSYPGIVIVLIGLFLMMNADVFFDASVIASLLACEYPDAIATDMGSPKISPSGEVLTV